LGGYVLKDNPAISELTSITNHHRLSQNADVGFGVAIYPEPDKLEVRFSLITPLGIRDYKRLYGGPREYGPLWALNQSLDIIRRISYDTTF
jgi:hypothetical protein